uniref:Uncharacterized protein n=1 Tax=Rhizophora mucronata TaxID=61149 RepID=A0A2P2NRY8_RHIMU
MLQFINPATTSCLAHGFAVLFLFSFLFFFGSFGFG